MDLVKGHRLLLIKITDKHADRQPQAIAKRAIIKVGL